MPSHDAAIVQQATPHLRPGESVTSTAYVERQVPAIIRTLSFVRFAYLEAFRVAVTNERILLFTLGGRAFGRPAGSPASIEHADLVKAEMVSTLAIGSEAMRLTLRNGLVYEFLVAKKLAGYDGQEAFVQGYVPWLAQGIAAQGFPRRGPEFPRLPGPDMPPMLGHWLLAVVGGLWGLMQLLNTFSNLANGYVAYAFISLILGALGGVPALFAIERIRTRSARLRGETPVALLELAKTHRTKVAIGAAALAALLVVGGIVSFISGQLDDQAEADLDADEATRWAAIQAEAAARQAAAAARPAIDRWPPVNPPPEPTLAAVPSVAAVRARFAALGFTLADGPSSNPQVAWTLVATGEHGQVLTILARANSGVPHDDGDGRGRYCVAASAASVCAQTSITESNYTLVDGWTYDKIKNDWSVWAARTAAAL